MLSAHRLSNLSRLAVTLGAILLVACQDDGGGAGSTATPYGGGVGETPTATTAGGGDGDSGTPTAEAGAVSVTLKEWSLTADPASVPAGNVPFSATNEGSFQHQLIVLKTDLAAGALPVSSGSVDLGTAGQVIGQIPTFSSGPAQTFALELESGAYVLLCNISGHYEQGVRSAFTVTATTSGGVQY